jgi:phenylacetate-CoA ligase
MSDFYSMLIAAEKRPHADRERVQLQALPAQIKHAQQKSVAFAEILAGVDAATVTSRVALASLPVTRKTELLDRQKTAREDSGSGDAVFGGFSTVGFGANMPRVFASPGTIYEPEGKQLDYWRSARALAAAGFKAGELIHNCFSYHFTRWAARFFRQEWGKPSNKYKPWPSSNRLVMLAHRVFSKLF